MGESSLTGASTVAAGGGDAHAIVDWRFVCDLVEASGGVGGARGAGGVGGAGGAGGPFAFAEQTAFIPCNIACADMTNIAYISRP
ncbi:unnamed protein product [Closterium sp. NIES-54]